MKTKLAVTTTTLALALAAAPFANSKERVRRIPNPPPSRTQPQVIHQRTAVPATEQPAQNVSVTLAGVIGADLPLDLTITGCAAKMNSDPVLRGGECPTIASVNYHVREAAGKSTVTYAIGIRMPIVTSSNGTNKSISFQEALLENTVHCKPGKPIEIYRSGKNSLSLTIAETQQE